MNREEPPTPDPISDPALLPTVSKGTESDLPAKEHPREIGPYRILQVLGEGGMGVVYLAERSKPMRQRVALKMSLQGMDNRQVVARFESERQALALMNHPNVAAVYDAGVSEDGRPYFVMEYVPGVSITKFCDTHRLTERLGESQPEPTVDHRADQVDLPRPA